MLDFIPCILICGCSGRTKVVKKPPPQLQAILDKTDHFYCVYCRTVREAVCYRHSSWFSLYCIPLFPYRRGQPYLGCGQCQHPVRAGSATNICGNCGRWVEEQQRYCGFCGELNRVH